MKTYAALIGGIVVGIVLGRCTVADPEPEPRSIVKDIIQCRILGFERPRGLKGWPEPARQKTEECPKN